jgi:hypothetical protein
MDDAKLLRRIHVVVVTTRAAASSLPPGNGQVHAAVRRGIQLLDGMAEEVEREGGSDSRERLAQARRELASLLDVTPT